MANGMETIGWILTVEDKATKRVEKITRHLEERVVGAAWKVSDLSDRIADLGDERGLVGKAIAKISNSFVRVLGSAFLETADLATRSFGKIAAGLVNTVTAPLKRITTGFTNMAEMFKEKGKAAADFFMVQEFTWEELLTGAGESAGVLIRRVVDLTRRVTKGLTPAFNKLLPLARKSTQEMGNLFQKVLSIETVTKGIKLMGGIAGVLLGPIGPLLSLFDPLIRMITRQFTPAIETFSAIVETAFGPFSMVLEIIARNLAKDLLPYIGPIASFLEIAAIQVGGMLRDLLRGKPEKLFATIFSTMRSAQPVVMNLINLLLDMGQQVGDVLLTSVVRLIPLVVKLGVNFLKAVTPLIKPMTKLVVTLIEKGLLPVIETVIKSLNQFSRDALPDIVKAFSQLLDAVLPLVAPLTKVITAIVSQLLTPAIINLSKGAASWIEDTLVPFIKRSLPGLKDAINTMTKFFEKIGGVIRVRGLRAGVWAFLKDFKKNVLDPIVLVVSNAIDDIFSKTNVRAWAYRFVEAVFWAAKKLAKKASDVGKVELARSLISERAAGRVTKDTSYGDIALASIYKALGGKERAKGAGMIQGPRGVGVPSIVGEAGPEMILPLRSDVVERVMAPLFPKLDFPALDRLVEIASNVERIMTMEGNKRPQEGSSMRLDDAVGMGGVGAW